MLPLFYSLQNNLHVKWSRDFTFGKVTSCWVCDVTMQLCGQKHRSTKSVEGLERLAKTEGRSPQRRSLLQVEPELLHSIGMFRCYELHDIAKVSAYAGKLGLEDIHLIFQQPHSVRHSAHVVDDVGHGDGDSPRESLQGHPPVWCHQGTNPPADHSHL